MPDVLQALPQLAALIEKAGIIGVLLIAAGLLAWYCLQLRRELARTYCERDNARLKNERYKTRLDADGIEVDVSDLDQQLLTALQNTK